MKYFTRAELFDLVTKIIGHKSEDNNKKAAAIFLAFDDYLGNYTERDGDGYYFIPESDSTDFRNYVLALYRTGKLYVIEIKDLLEDFNVESTT